MMMMMMMMTKKKIRRSKRRGQSEELKIIGKRGCECRKRMIEN